MAEDSPIMGELSFYVPPSSDSLIALPELSFEFEMSIKRKKPSAANWERIVDADKVAPVNLIAHSIFQSCQVSLCNRTISDTAVHYPYRAMLEVLTTYSPDSASSQLTASGFYLDTPGKHNDNTNNLGEKSRHDLFVASEWVELSGKVISGEIQPMLPLIFVVISSPWSAFRYYVARQEPYPRSTDWCSVCLQ
jgi:hypothetical protein